MNAAELEQLQRHIEAQQRLIHQLIAAVEKLQESAFQGPDAVTRRRMLELAGTVVSVDAGVARTARELAATQLALDTLKSIPAPRPVEVPSPVVEQKSGGSRVS